MNNDQENFFSLALTGEWHIEDDFAMSSLLRYARAIQLRASRFDSVEKIFERNKEKSKGEIIRIESNNGKVSTVSGWRLYYPSDTPPNSFAYLRLKGLMTAQEEPCTYGVSELISDIEAALLNQNVIGILLEVNSGGGESQAGKFLHSTLSDAVLQKPVVSYVNGVMASAAVLGTLASTEIVANPKISEIGSIGTYISINKAFLQFYKENVEEIYADDSQNKNSIWRALLSGDPEPLKAQLNKTNVDFMDQVKSYRPLKGKDDYVKHTLSGAMFKTDEAKKRGLIDSVGNKEFALKRLLYHAKNKIQ